MASRTTATIRLAGTFPPNDVESGEALPVAEMQVAHVTDLESPASIWCPHCSASDTAQAPNHDTSVTRVFGSDRHLMPRLKSSTAVL